MPADRFKTPDTPSLGDWLPWTGLLNGGVVVNKDGSFMACIEYRGPDLGSSTKSELVTLTAQLNTKLRKLGENWAIYAEAKRIRSIDYPVSTFPNQVSHMIDEERRIAFGDAGNFFETRFYLSVQYLPEGEQGQKLERFIIDDPNASGETDARKILEKFDTAVNNLVIDLKDCFKEVRRLTHGDLLTYLHSTCSTRRHDIAMPCAPIFIDHMLADEQLIGGQKPILGDKHMRAITVIAFPSHAFPAMLHEVQQLDFEFRWMSRFIFLGREDGEKAIRDYKKRHFGGRMNLFGLLQEMMGVDNTANINEDALLKAEDAGDALTDLKMGAVDYGYLTSTVIVLGDTAQEADERANIVSLLISRKDFPTMIETINSVDAFFGSIPGNAHSNVRKPIIDSFNLAKALPISAVWAGDERVEHLDGPPLFYAITEGSTPFRADTYNGQDLGHTFVVGPPGAGKSTFIAFSALQWLRYPDARVIFFDKGRSIRAATMGVGGSFTDLANPEELSFQPLRHIDGREERVWANDWLQQLLINEGVEVTPEIKDEIAIALDQLASDEPEGRTLSLFKTMVQNDDVRAAIRPFVDDGPCAFLLDSDKDDFEVSNWQAFEMGGLMGLPQLLPPTLSYLFRQIQNSLTGQPTLIILDEAWIFLKDEIFLKQIDDWLRTLRKNNAVVMFATQSVNDVVGSPLFPVIHASCPTHVFLSNPSANSANGFDLYSKFNLNETQINLIATATPKRDYYISKPQGNRLIQLGLSDLALAYTGASRPEDQEMIDKAIASGGDFNRAWLSLRGLGWAADAFSNDLLRVAAE